MEKSLRGGGKILLAGNGGSAADAQHIAGELLSRLYFDRAPLPAIALTTDTSVLTAIGNDYGYEDVFARQVAGSAARATCSSRFPRPADRRTFSRRWMPPTTTKLHTVAFTGNAECAARSQVYARLARALAAQRR